MKEEKSKKQLLSNKIKRKYKQIIIVALLIGIIIYSGYAAYQLVSHPTDVFMVENGKVSLEETVEGYIIRDEQVVQGKNYKNGIVPIKAEGEKAAKDEAIFRYYSNGEENLIKKIAELDQKIDEEKGKENVNLPSSDIKVIEKEIDSKLEQIYHTNDMQKITEYKKEIANLITKKTKIIGTFSPSGSYLKKLIEERSNYENQLNSGSEYVKSPTGGSVSYKVDGLENVLKPDQFSNLNEQLLSGLNLKTGQIIASNNECGKVVNNYECYIAMIMEKEKAHDVKQGSNVSIRLSNTEETEASVHYVQDQENGKILIVLKIKKEVQELINYRKISFDIIFWSYSGLKVPNTAIIEENNLSYLVRNRAGYLDKVLVKVKRKNDTYSIVGNYDTEELKDLGFSSSQIRTNKTIMIYDEVLTDPDPKKIK